MVIRQRFWIEHATQPINEYSNKYRAHCDLIDIHRIILFRIRLINIILTQTQTRSTKSVIGLVIL